MRTGWVTSSVHALFSVYGNIARDAFSSSTWGDYRIVLRGGVVLPTGSIEARDDLPAGPDQKLPYPMQVGSGTFSLVPGVVYLGASGDWAWEVESLATVRLGSNDGGYTLGNRLATTFWGARKVHSNVSVSGRFTLGGWSDIDGADSDLNPMMVPTADPLLRAGRRLEVAMGLNAYLPSGGPSEGVRVGVEAGLPVRQWLDGPQLGNEFYVVLGLGWTF
jgi:hypothetical protein